MENKKPTDTRQNQQQYQSNKPGQQNTSRDEQSRRTEQGGRTEQRGQRDQMFKGGKTNQEKTNKTQQDYNTPKKGW